MGDYATMPARFFEQSLTIAEQMGDKVSIAESLINIASAHQILGELDNAKLTFERSLHLFREVGHQFGEGLALHGLGSNLSPLGRPEICPSFSQREFDASPKIRR
jgi:hypothetical protein